MNDIRAQQIEALQAAKDYIPKLRNGIQNLYKELTQERLEDTDEYLNKVIEGVNWVIQVFNGTRDVINEKEEHIQKDIINDSVLKLNDALREKDDAKTADILLHEIAPFLQQMELTCGRIVGAN